MAQRALIEKLASTHSLEVGEYEHLLTHADADDRAQLAALAVAARKRVYGTAVFTRGLIEISNYCKNDCLYCGIRKSNGSCERYRLDPEVIARCADEGYELGFRTFVLQGGEDPWFTDERLCGVVARIKEAHPDCAVTLSMGERSRVSYQRLFDAGADRYLLRHETATASHYAQLHPAEMRLETRMRCLHDLRQIGYAVGVGFMVGSPFQTPAHLAADLKFIEEFQPEMCGIGPFVPHHATPFAGRPAGTVELTCLLLSIIRLIKPNVLLPATTALGTIDPQGREKGILAGANVVMPNLSPVDVRHAYELYDNKICTGEEAAECRGCLGARMMGIGYEIVIDRGDPRCHPERARPHVVIPSERSESRDLIQFARGPSTPALRASARDDKGRAFRLR
ncbi:MAG: [FeFe] hydrogenase H-cluster radical SAM maturase HydE [Coriobacteriia bacterium]|nr:[FeFe] hydrogenase H-cluster radical SAM maturase HydE [Coriobacteriia bacterium]